MGKMEFYGLMKLTLLDYPGKVACTIFTGGCNFCCPFCHNALIVKKEAEEIFSEEDILKFLAKRKGILDGVCISGGEPLLHDDLIPFMEKVKNLGYSVKLDTNGSFPGRLEKVIKSGFCDYVAMDIKNSFDRYSETVGIGDVKTDNISESISIIKNSGIDHEFRTTVAKELHSDENMARLAQMIENEDKYFIQNYRENENVLIKGLTPFDEEGLKKLLLAVQKYVPKASLRGIE